MCRAFRLFSWVWAALAVALCLAACAPMEQPHLPVVAAPEIVTETFRPGNEANLPLRMWLPETNPEAVIIALHGFNDYSRAFEGPGEYLKKQGVAFYAYDQRGFGATDSHGIWAGERNLVTDLKQMVQAVKTKHPGVPVFVLGESMGGAVVIAAASEPDFPPVDGLILSAPAVWGSETMNGFYRSTLWLMSHTMPGATVTGQGVRILASDNIPMLRAMAQDPLIIKKTRIDAIYGIVGLMDEAYNRIAQVKTPMLFLYGAKDQVIPRQPVGLVIQKVMVPYNVAYYPDGYHMLLRDLKAETVLADILHWIRYPTRQLPSGYDRDWREILSVNAKN